MSPEARIDRRPPEPGPVGRPQAATPSAAVWTLADRLVAGRLTPLQTTRLARGLLIALREAHERGALFGDLHPGAVLLDPGDPEAARAGLTRAGASALEAARYAAPERAGLVDRPVDARADLYALGVILYECLAGAPPFDAPTLGEVLRHHLHSRPPSLCAPAVRAPRGLDDVIARLLAKDARDRYQSAIGALADVTELEAALARGALEPALVPGRYDRRRTMVAPAFVGRDAELTSALAEIERARRGDGRVCLVESESGGGKTRFLDELARRAASAGALVLRGRSLEGALSSPLEIFAGVAQALVVTARAEPTLGTTLRERLGAHADTLCAVLPALAPLLADHSAPGAPGDRPGMAAGPEPFGDNRVQEALGALLAGVGSPDRPAVLLLDDAQWMHGAPELIPRLLTGYERRRGPRETFVVVAFRTEEVPASHPLRRSARRALLRLPTLDPAAICALAESMAGPVPPEALALVCARSQGSPFFAVAALYGMLESQALVFEAGAWRVDEGRLAELPSSERAADLLLRRVESLPPSVARLLEIGAILGQEFDLALVAGVAGTSEAEATAAAEEARSRHILWFSPATPCVFAHHRLRHAFLDRLSPEARARLHQAVATHMEARTPGEVFQLARHFDAAGDPARAFPHAVAAAARARAGLAFGLAEECYRVAERGAPPGDLAVRAQLAEALGEVLFFTGRAVEAPRELERALTLAARDEDKARILALMGEAYYRQGDFENAQRVGEAGLTLLGRRPPRRVIHFAVAVGAELAVQALHSLLPRWRGRGPLEAAGRDRLAIRLYCSLVFSSFLVRTPLMAFWAHLRELNLAECYGPSPELARACLNHGVALGQIPWRRRAFAYFERARATALAVGDPITEGACDTYHSMVLCWGGANEAALEVGARGRATLRRAGDRFGAVATGGPIAIAMYRLGRVEEVLEHSQRYFAEGVAIGDASAVGTALHVWALASGGRVPVERVEQARALCVDAYPRIFVHGVEGLTCLAGGDLVGAERALERAMELIGAQRNGIVADIPCWLATVRRLLAERIPPHHPARRGAVRRAAATLRDCQVWARICVGLRPHVLREAAHLAALDGRSRKARRLIAASHREATRQGARVEAAWTRVAAGLIGRALGWPEADGEHAAGSAELRALRADLPGLDADLADRLEPTLSLIDRFDTVLQAGRQIAVALTRERVVDAIREATVTLLRADGCTIVEAASEGAVTGVVDNRPMEPDRASLVFPIAMRGRAVLLVRAASAWQSGHFGREEERLAQFIAALGGAALENAEGFERLALAERQIRDLSNAAMHAQEEERRRFATALHDGAGQALSAALLQLEALGDLVPRGPERTEPLRRLLTGTLEELRRMSHALRPAALDTLGLVPALRELLGSVATPRLRVALEVCPADIGPLPPVVALHVFRIAQTALSNVMRHARAGVVTLALTREPAALVLDLSDDGRGFDPAAVAPHGGMGLLSMQERALAVGGVCAVTGRAGGGTRVRVSVPVEAT